MGAWVKDNNNKEKLDKLDGRIAQFRNDWKAKYGEEAWGNLEQVAGKLV